jgi:hypothetical protein
MAIIALRSRSPWLGNRSADVKDTWRIIRLRLWPAKTTCKPERAFLNAISSELDFDDPALNPDHGGVGSIICTQLGEDVPDVALHRIFGGRQQRRNFFVAIAVGNQAQNAHFQGGQGVFSGMLGKLERDFRGKVLSPGVYGPDRIQQFLVQAIF